MKTRFFAVIAVLLCASCADRDSKKTRTPNEVRAEAGLLPDLAAATKCEVTGTRETRSDLNQDGVPDVRTVYVTVGDGEVMACREADINFDGTLDLYMFFDDVGKMKRDEVDLDLDGRIDIVTHYADGKIIRQDIDQNSDGIADRVRHLLDGVVIKLEGDTDQNGRIDYWEYYEGGRLVRIGVDEDGDGMVDVWEKDKEALAEGAEEDAGAEEGEESAEGAEEGTADDKAPVDKTSEQKTKSGKAPASADENPYGE